MDRMAVQVINVSRLETTPDVKTPVGKMTSWLAEHMIELGLLNLAVVALIIGMALPLLNGPFVDMMGYKAKLALSVGIACGFVGFFGCIVVYQFTRSRLLIIACIFSLYALILFSMSFSPHL